MNEMLQDEAPRQPVRMVMGMVVGEFVELVVDPTALHSLGLDLTTLSASLMTVGLDGGAPLTLASALLAPRGLSVQAPFVYGSSGGGKAGIVIEKGSILGGPTAALATRQENPATVVADTTSLYWTNAGNSDDMFGGVVKLTPR
jgi:hypothetical protein